MKKLLVAIIILNGLIFTGCAKKVVKSEAEAVQVDLSKVPMSFGPEVTAKEVEEKEVTEVVAKKEEKAIQEVGGLVDIFFDYDRSYIRDGEKSTLEANASYLTTNTNVNITIEGHCDERGTSEYNIALGEKRAQSVKSYLVSLGIASGRISTISYGKEKPFCRGHNEQCWQENRRGHFVEK